MALNMNVSAYYGDEEIFVPGEIPPVEFDLEPVEDEPGVLPPVEDRMLPATYTFKPFSYAKPEKKALVLNLETTGIMPTDSIVFSIGVKDPATPEAPPYILIDDDEERLVKTFFDFFETQGYNQLIGYNVGFDYRFLFVEAEKYRIPIKTFVESDLYDVMNQQQQVKQAFVPGFNKAGKLDEWAELLLGMKAPHEQMDVLKAWERNDRVIIEEYQMYKVEACFQLWALAQGVFGKAELEVETELVDVEKGSIHALEKQNCVNCNAEAFVTPEQTSFVCDVCESSQDVVRD